MRSTYHFRLPRTLRHASCISATTGDIGASAALRIPNPFGSPSGRSKQVTVLPNKAPHHRRYFSFLVTLTIVQVPTSLARTKRYMTLITCLARSSRLLTLCVTERVPLGTWGQSGLCDLLALSGLPTGLGQISQGPIAENRGDQTLSFLSRPAKPQPHIEKSGHSATWRLPFLILIGESVLSSRDVNFRVLVHTPYE